MKLSLHLVTWNGARWLPGLFESLRKMDFRLQPSDFSLLVLDNGSTDGTAEMLKKELPTLPFPYQLIEGKENVGFAAGHNTLFEIREKRYERDDSGYVLIFNQDLFFEPDCIGKLVHFLNAHPDAAAVAPRLMRILALPARGRDPARLASKRAQGGGDNQPSALIDSLGLKKYRTWKVADIAAGHVWKPTAESPASPKTASRGG